MRGKFKIIPETDLKYVKTYLKTRSLGTKSVFENVFVWWVFAADSNIYIGFLWHNIVLNNGVMHVEQYFNSNFSFIPNTPVLHQMEFSNFMNILNV